MNFTFFSKFSFGNNIKMLNSIDPDHAHRSIWHVLGQICLQKSSADNKFQGWH